MRNPLRPSRGTRMLCVFVDPIQYHREVLSNGCSGLLVTSCSRSLQMPPLFERNSRSWRYLHIFTAFHATSSLQGCWAGRKTQRTSTHFVSLGVLLLMGWLNEAPLRSSDPANLLLHANSRVLDERDRSMITSPRSHVDDQPALQLDQLTTSQPLSSETC
jgi:hypothetical protein